MKICVCICEYNPFHNGHKYHLLKAKELSGCDCVVAVMGGNFTQRGEPAVTDKYTRAIHAIKGGADMVVELPAVFATANAENFALGGVKTAKMLGASVISFGCEHADKNAFLNTAKLLLDESDEVKLAIKEGLKAGYKPIKARFEAYKKLLPVSEKLLSHPNDILGVEYVKAILKLYPECDFLPVERVGANHNDGMISGEYSSATAIRNNLSNRELIKGVLPSFVLEDLPTDKPNFDKITLYSALFGGQKRLASTPDCSEGLENRILSYAGDSLTREELVEKVLCKRYTKTRIERILTANALGITKKLLSDCLKYDLYIKVLAIKEDKKELLSAISKGNDVIMTYKDSYRLKETKKRCFDLDLLATRVYSVITDKKIEVCKVKIVK